ncbi:MAG: peptidylprolyl isomerase [Nanoarchaeota archaeon]|nr:peptidylprolyl isomerase [Nanoarchaeota archaeon]
MVKESNNPQVLIKTSLGDITLELYPDKAPITVENFLSYVNEKSYDNTVFHRVIDGFMIQGGGFTEDGKQKPAKPPIKLESDNGLKNTIGTVAMARTTVPDSATNQFFINTNDNYFLNNGFKDEGYAVFGKVTDGMDIVKNIEKVKTLQKNGMTDWPESNVIIKSIRVVE